MHLLLKYKVYFFIVITLTGIAVLVNACKKDNSDNVAYFLTYNKWTLASVTRQNFVGDTLKSTDTLNVACTLAPQVFTFSNSGTCTYTNYHCIAQSSTGTWQLANGDLLLQTNMTAQDTSSTGVKTGQTVFQTAQVINLGQYSLVLQTGYLSTIYSSKTKRLITRYGFIHTSY